jgi:uncharacterized protein (DUF433 family)
MRGLGRITSDPQIMAGPACIRGTRGPVSLVLHLVSHGVRTAGVLAPCTGQT